MAAVKVAIVTGGNKGIGYAIVRALCKQFTGHVYLTARNEELGKAAVEKLKAEGLQAHFHQLDITDSASISRLAASLETKYGGVDILINNAGIAYKASSDASFGEQATVTCRTNYTGTLDMCKKFLPLMREHGRIVNVASRAGSSGTIKDAKLKERLLSDTLAVDELTSVMDQFVARAQEGKIDESVFKKWAYGISKMGVIVLTRLLQRDCTKNDVLINCCCPGFIATDMTSYKGHKTIDEGADTPVYLALLPPDNAANPRGAFLAEREELDWATWRFVPLSNST